MTRLSRIESRQQTREKLLEAARHSFTRAGYAGTSVDMIAEAAGFSKGALYSNFESKEAIFLDLLEQHMSGEVATSAGFLPRDSSADEAIERIAARYASDPVDLNWCLLSIEFALHATRSPAFAARRAELFARHYQDVAAIITAVAERAGTSVVDPEAAAAVFVALRQGLALERSQRSPALDEADVQKALTAWMRDLLKLDVS
jgi:AcrR family transcriptional regulator